MAKLGLKDQNGAYLPPGPKPPLVDNVTVDELFARGLTSVNRLMKLITMEITAGSPSRECVQNLKDCMTILKDLKDREKELLESLNEEQLLAKANDQPKNSQD